MGALWVLNFMRIGPPARSVSYAARSVPKVTPASQEFDPSRQGRAVTKLAEREADASAQLKAPLLDPAVEMMLAEKGIFPSKG